MFKVPNSKNERLYLKILRTHFERTCQKTSSAGLYKREQNQDEISTSKTKSINVIWAILSIVETARTKNAKTEITSEKPQEGKSSERKNMVGKINNRGSISTLQRRSIHVLKTMILRSWLPTTRIEDGENWLRQCISEIWNHLSTNKKKVTSWLCSTDH